MPNGKKKKQQEERGHVGPAIPVEEGREAPPRELQKGLVLKTEIYKYPGVWYNPYGHSAIRFRFFNNGEEVLLPESEARQYFSFSDVSYTPSIADTGIYTQADVIETFQPLGDQGPKVGEFSKRFYAAMQRDYRDFSESWSRPGESYQEYLDKVKALPSANEAANYVLYLVPNKKSIEKIEDPNAVFIVGRGDKRKAYIRKNGGMVATDKGITQVTVDVKRLKAQEVLVKARGEVRQVATRADTPDAQIALSVVRKVLMDASGTYYFGRSNAYHVLWKNCSHATRFLLQAARDYLQKERVMTHVDEVSTGGISTPHGTWQLAYQIRLEEVARERERIKKDDKLTPRNKIIDLIENDITRLKIEIRQQEDSWIAVGIDAKKKKIEQLEQLKEKADPFAVPNDDEATREIEKAAATIGGRTAQGLQECLQICWKQGWKGILTERAVPEAGLVLKTTIYRYPGSLSSPFGHSAVQFTFFRDGKEVSAHDQQYYFSFTGRHDPRDARVLESSFKDRGDYGTPQTMELIQAIPEGTVKIEEFYGSMEAAYIQYRARGLLQIHNSYNVAFRNGADTTQFLLQEQQAFLSEKMARSGEAVTNIPHIVKAFGISRPTHVWETAYQLRLQEVARERANMLAREEKRDSPRKKVRGLIQNDIQRLEIEILAQQDSWVAIGITTKKNKIERLKGLLELEDDVELSAAIDGLAKTIGGRTAKGLRECCMIMPYAEAEVSEPVSESHVSEPLIPPPPESSIRLSVVKSEKPRDSVSVEVDKPDFDLRTLVKKSRPANVTVQQDKETGILKCRVKEPGGSTEGSFEVTRNRMTTSSREPFVVDTMVKTLRTALSGKMAEAHFTVWAKSMDDLGMLHAKLVEEAGFKETQITFRLGSEKGDQVDAKLLSPPPSASMH